MMFSLYHIYVYVYGYGYVCARAYSDTDPSGCTGPEFGDSAGSSAVDPTGEEEETGIAESECGI